MTIIDYFDGPIVKELLIDCPRCGEMFTVIGDGEAATRVAAITVTLRRGEDVDAVCAKCGTRWHGRTEVIHLGRLAGLTIDVDAIRDALIRKEAG